MYRKYFKRVFDFILSLVLLVLLFPIMLVITILLTIANQGSPFFYHERPGQHEKKVKIIKFKSMNDKKDNHGNLLPDNERLTYFGKIIRATSVDELPQLINVLKGDMSLIGPRPLLFRYIPLYSPGQRRRHEVKPGITGLAQVKGRNAIDWQTKFKYDVYYVDNISFALDMKIFFLTIKKVLLKEGINQSSQRPMQPFTGSENR